MRDESREVQRAAEYGEPLKYDPEFHGPLKRRSCTDVICVFLLGAFIAGWIAIGAFALLNGDKSKLLVPKDSLGRRCGYDSSVANKPYLFFFDITKCLGKSLTCSTPQVCIERCPEKSFTYTKGVSNLQDLICNDGTPKSHNQAEEWIDQGKCAKWYLETVSVKNRCVPNVFDARFTDMTEQQFRKATKTIKLLIKSREMGESIIEDIITARWHISVGIGVGLVASLIYILLLKWIAATMVWFSIFSLIVVLSSSLYYSVTRYQYYKNYNGPIIDSDELSTKQTQWLSITITLSVTLGIVLLVLLVLRKRIKLAIELIREASKAINAVTSSLFFPLLPWLLQGAVMLYGIAVFLYLTTVGDSKYVVQNLDGCSCSGPAQNYKNGMECVPEIFATYCQRCVQASCHFDGLKRERNIFYLHIINLFGFFWGIAFTSALSQMTLALTFATWYWTFNKSKLPCFLITEAFFTTLTYHTGTLAFGSLIIAVCKMIRTGIEYVNQKLKAYDNEFTKCILRCLGCFFWCLEKFLKFINKNAYVMCAIHGTNFCTSARDAFSLLMRNILRVFVLNKVSDFLFFISKLLITAGVTCVAYAFLITDTNKMGHVEINLNYPLLPVVIIGVITFLITCIFFSVFSMAVDTLFLCFLEDCERNDGSLERPYYMSKNLMKVLNRKND